MSRRPFWWVPLFWILAAGAPARSGQEDLALGRTLFLRHCAECHGASGDGYGPRQDITYARPRSFLTGRFKLATTTNRIPSDDDLMRTIRKGMPGTGMPSWSQLDEHEILALVRYVRSVGADRLRKELDQQVAAGALSSAEAAARFAERTEPGPPIEAPPEPPKTEGGLRRGGEIYREACAPCHGALGDAPAGSVKTDLEGNWLLPTSLSKGLFKGGSDGFQLYARIFGGLDGTAMPGFEGAYSGLDLWNLVHFVSALSTEGLPSDLRAELESNAAHVSEGASEAAAQGVVADSPSGGSGSVRADPSEAALNLPEKEGPAPSLDRWIAIIVLIVGVSFLIAILRPRPRPSPRSGPRSIDR